jgi:hypothetical protein
VVFERLHLGHRGVDHKRLSYLRTHAKNLSSAIYQQDAVAKQLSKVSGDIWTTTNSQQVSRLRSELSQVGKPGVGLGKFDPDREVGALDIPALAGRIQRAAPELSKLLADLMIQQHSSGHVTSTDSQGSLVMACSIIARAYAPRNCNNFPVLLGLIVVRRRQRFVIIPPLCVGRGMMKHSDNVDLRIKINIDRI